MHVRGKNVSDTLSKTSAFPIHEQHTLIFNTYVLSITQSDTAGTQKAHENFLVTLFKSPAIQRL
uniref:Uncharacterized protein n=1 Tax=Candidatus Kentrum eta TaxID=2126337 RepID=A0A450V1J4_9GAMM|nr:MAG: hypothetical protein BECKH772A_GA0070896_100257 [Candidatus Kentron sp. H]VFJ92104.1 MAG: hypothetical protein BECKH772B_GA0070898_100257 [Candidatus Kentron sp. H]VFJ98678.1 MAG: hypothetical protein BECKH772C_GA0070978_100247 [Candidatus Kentron sp. H]